MDMLKKGESMLDDLMESDLIGFLQGACYLRENKSFSDADLKTIATTIGSIIYKEQDIAKPLGDMSLTELKNAFKDAVFADPAKYYANFVKFRALYLLEIVYNMFNKTE